MATIMGLSRRSSFGHGLQQLEESGEANSRRVRARNAHALTGHDSSDPAQNGQPVVAASVHAPTPGAGGYPSHPEAIVPLRDPHAKGFQRIFHSFDAVRFLVAQLAGAAA